MSVFSLTKSQQIIKWREFRESIKDFSELEKIEKVMKYWQKAPLTTFVIDWDTASFPSPWEVINDGYYDSILIAYMIKETLILTGFEKDRIKLCYVRNNEFEGMLVIIDNKFLINYSYDEILDYNNYKNNLKFIRIDDKII